MVVVTLISHLLLLTVVSANVCPWQEDSLVAWSDPASWESGALPAAGDNLVIKRGILIDLDSPLGDVILMGRGKIVFTPHTEEKLRGQKHQDQAERIPANERPVQSNSRAVSGNSSCRIVQ